MNINVICFLIVTFIAIICGAIEYKMKLPDWKLLIAWTILMEVLAVVKLAADDYRRALIRLRRHPKDTNALHTKNECELFFRKGIETYSDMDGEVLIKGIQERVRREYNEQRAVK